MGVARFVDRDACSCSRSTAAWTAVASDAADVVCGAVTLPAPADSDPIPIETNIAAAAGRRTAHWMAVVLSSVCWCLPRYGLGRRCRPAPPSISLSVPRIGSG
jgi:hypothetical protein